MGLLMIGQIGRKLKIDPHFVLTLTSLKFLNASTLNLSVAHNGITVSEEGIVSIDTH